MSEKKLRTIRCTDADYDAIRVLLRIKNDGRSTQKPCDPSGVTISEGESIADGSGLIEREAKRRGRK